MCFRRRRQERTSRIIPSHRDSSIDGLPDQLKVGSKLSWYPEWSGHPEAKNASSALRHDETCDKKTNSNMDDWTTRNKWGLVYVLRKLAKHGWLGQTAKRALEFGTERAKAGAR